MFGLDVTTFTQEGDCMANTGEDYEEEDRAALLDMFIELALIDEVVRN